MMKKVGVFLKCNSEELEKLQLIRNHFNQFSHADTVRMMIQFCHEQITKSTTDTRPLLSGVAATALQKPATTITITCNNLR